MENVLNQPSLLALIRQTKGSAQVAPKTWRLLGIQPLLHRELPGAHERDKVSCEDQCPLACPRRTKWLLTLQSLFSVHAHDVFDRHQAFCYGSGGGAIEAMEV